MCVRVDEYTCECVHVKVRVCVHETLPVQD